MSELQRLNFSEHNTLEIVSDSEVFSDSSSVYCEPALSWHAEGFPVFISKDKLSHCDEYADADPYTVAVNIDSEFHRRRIDLTVALVKQALAGVKANSVNVLDVGCGQGHITDRLRQALPETKIYAMDYSVSAVAYAHKHFPDIEFAVADAYALPYETHLFDVVVCNNIWEHVPDPLYLLARIKRVLKPGGHIVISTPSRYRLSNLLNVLRGKPVKLMSKYHVTEYSVGQVKEQLAFGGFDVVSALSRPSAAWSFKSNLARRVFSKLIAWVGSHHRLEETIFYLAQKRTPTRSL